MFRIFLCSELKKHKKLSKNKTWPDLQNIVLNTPRYITYDLLADLASSKNLRRKLLSSLPKL